MSKSKTSFTEALKELTGSMDLREWWEHNTCNSWEDEDQQCPHGSRWMLGCYSCRATVDTHTHTVARYIGFTDSYDYCTECGEKL